MDGDGLLTYDDLVEIVEQYVDSLESMGITVKRKGTVSVDGKLNSHTQRGVQGNKNLSSQGPSGPNKNGIQLQGGGPGGPNRAVTLDALLTQAARETLKKFDPDNTHWFTQERCTQALLMMFYKVPDMGRAPSERWCAAAFKNFDQEGAGQIHVESWCEIIR